MDTTKPDPEKRLHDILSFFDKIDKVKLAQEIQQIDLTENLLNTLDGTEKFRLRMLMKLVDTEDNTLAFIESMDIDGSGYLE